MNNFELHELAEELLIKHTPYKVAKELVITKNNYDNLLWEYKQVKKEIDKPKNTFGSPATEQDAIDWAITMVDEGW